MATAGENLSKLTSGDSTIKNQMCVDFLLKHMENHGLWWVFDSRGKLAIGSFNEEQGGLVFIGKPSPF